MERGAFCSIRHPAPPFSYGSPRCQVQAKRQGVLSVLLTPVSFTPRIMPAMELRFSECLQLFFIEHSCGSGTVLGNIKHVIFYSYQTPAEGVRLP